MNNGINLAFLAQAPALVDQSQQAAQPAGPSSSSNQLFAHLLMQKMSPGSALSDANDGGQSLSGQDMSGIANFLDLNPSSLSGLSGDSNIASLINAIKEQLGKKDDSSSALSAILDGKNNGKDANATDPMMATWLAAMAALQLQQPRLDESKLGVAKGDSADLLTGIQSQLGGAPDSRMLKALQLAFSHLNDRNQIPTNVSGPNPENTTAQISPNAVATAAPTTRPDEAAMQALAAEMNTMAGSQNVNSAAKVELPKPDSKALSPSPAVAAAGNADRSQQVQPAVVPPQADAKANGQGNYNQGDSNQGASNQSTSNSTGQQNGDGRSSGDSRKSTQFDQISSKFDVQSVSASSTPEQNAATAVFQPIAHNAMAEQSHTAQTVNNGKAADIRDVAHLAPLENVAPRTVNQASLMQAASQAEMRVSVKTEAAGTMDVRAVLEGNHISATIAAQHSSTRDWLVANSHELNQSLSRDDLRLKTFEVTESQLRNDMQGSASGHREQTDAQKPQQYFQGRKDSPFTSTLNGEELETETSGTAKRAISLLA